MAEQLKPMAVNPGDPITSELMSSIVSNINIINSMANSTVVAAGSDDKPTTGQVIIESNRILVPCNTSGTGQKPVAFTKTFTKAPFVTCTVYQGNANNFLKLKYQPVVTEVSVNGFTVRMMPVGATGGGNIYVHWIAVGS